VKVFAIVDVARQINGDMVFVKIEKAYTNISKAQEYLKTVEEKTTELIQNSSGFSVECSCLKSLYEIDVEEDLK
jgi:hypothetical protein